MVEKLNQKALGTLFRVPDTFTNPKNGQKLLMKSEPAGFFVETLKNTGKPFFFDLKM